MAIYQLNRENSATSFPGFLMALMLQIQIKMITKSQSKSPNGKLISSYLLVATTFIFIAFISPAEGSDDAQISSTRLGIDIEQESIIQEGKARFIQTCAYCHGQEGEAGKTRPFKTHTNWDPQAIFDTITNGRQRGGNIMPTWKDSIPPEEIWKIVAYIKSLSAPK